jgi:hypothetical protein
MTCIMLIRKRWLDHLRARATGLSMPIAWKHA